MSELNYTKGDWKVTGTMVIVVSGCKRAIKHTRSPKFWRWGL